MAKDPGIGYRVMATITGVKGQCNAGHKVGEKFRDQLSQSRRVMWIFLSRHLSQHTGNILYFFGHKNLNH
jgi:hypothetical protein